MDKMHETPDRDGIGGSECARTDNDSASVPDTRAADKPALDGASPEGRRMLLANGYDPILLNGKAPVSEGWQVGTITSERLAGWESQNPAGANTGLRTGALSVADIDLWNPEDAAAVAEAICDVLGVTLLRRVGQKGVALLFHNPDPIRKITVSGKAPDAKPDDKPQKIEFLGTGQQVAAFGVHPDTGRHYDWTSAALGDTPLDISLAELPEVTPAMIREAATVAMNTLTKLGYSDLRISESGASRDGDNSAMAGEPIDLERLTAMLACIDPACDRMTWIAVAGAIKSARVIDRATGEDNSDFDGLDLFIRWSAGDLSEDHAPGNYEGPADCEATWNSLTATRRGGSNVGTLVFHARRGGYAGPSSIPAIERLRGVSDGGAEHQGNARDIPDDAGEAVDWFAPVADLNERFAIVTGGKHAGRIADLSNPRAPHFLDGTRFHAIYRDAKTTPPATEGEAVPKPGPISRFWEGWSGRRKVTGVEFVPPGSRTKLPQGAHNLWQGFAVEPKQGEAHRHLLAHLSRYVCHGDEEHFEFLMAWMANLVQEPGNKPGVAIALCGEQGAGKTILYRYLEAMLGGHAAAVDSPKLVVGNFNSHLSGLCLLGVEEGFWAGSREAESRLKHLITSDSIMLEQKGVDAIKIANHARVLVTSNADWVVPVGAGDRRWAVFNVDPARRNDESYWKPIYDALGGDGPANLLHYLLNYRYDPEILFRPPMTKAKAEQATESMDSVSQWWLEVLRDDRDPAAGRVTSKGDTLRTDGVFEADTFKETIYKDYQAWCDGARRFKALTDNSFWRRLKRLVPASFKEWRPHGESRVVWFPPRARCRSKFGKCVGCQWSDLES